MQYAARQPILNLHGIVHGYELLFRNGPEAAFRGDGDFAMRNMLDSAMLFGVEKCLPAPGVPLETLAQECERVIAKVADEGVSEEDLARAKTRLIADSIYAQDNQATLGRWYGSSLATGQTVEEVTRWPEMIEAVTIEDIVKATHWLDKRRSVTGFLLPADSGHTP